MKNSEKINFAIVGYGNLGKACETQILKRPDEFNLIGIFSRRESADTILLDKIKQYRDKIDVALFCGGSNDDAPIIVPNLNRTGISTVDGYDNHSEIKNQKYLKAIQTEAEKSGTTSIVGAGWDPGYLSIQRIYNKAIMPDAAHNTFFGGTEGGLSMGHTNAVKNIAGVLNAVQFTVTRKDAQAKALESITVPSNDKHRRICYIVAENGMEQDIEKKIREMEGYFKDQEVMIYFISREEFENRFAKIENHSGQIISADNNAKINLQLEMKSNPLFTANAMLAFGKANKKMQQRGIKGVYTVAEIPPAYLVDEATHLSNI